MRYGFLFILVLFIIALIVLQTINMKAGRQDAESYGLIDKSAVDQQSKGSLLPAKFEEVNLSD